jgi:hypothetical protein
VSAFVVSLVVLACCGLFIVGAALLRMYGAERRRGRREVSAATRVADSKSTPRQSRS